MRLNCSKQYDTAETRAERRILARQCVNTAGQQVTKRQFVLFKTLYDPVTNRDQCRFVENNDIVYEFEWALTDSQDQAQKYHYWFRTSDVSNIQHLTGSDMCYHDYIVFYWQPVCWGVDNED